MIWAIWYIAIGAIVGAAFWGQVLRVVRDNAELEEALPREDRLFLDMLRISPNLRLAAVAVIAFTWPVFIWKLIKSEFGKADP